MMKYGDLVHFGTEVMMVIASPVSAFSESEPDYRIGGWEFESQRARRSDLIWTPCTEACKHLPSGVHATAADLETPYPDPLTEVR